MSDRGITIVWATSYYRVETIAGIAVASGTNRIDGQRVRIEVECAQGMDEKIFAYRMLPYNPKTGQLAGFYSHVCSPVDLAEFPEDEPQVGFAPEWFRLSFVDILLRSVEEAENFIELVRQDVRALKRSLDSLDTIAPVGTYVLGEVCVPVAESSSSASLASLSSSSVGADQILCAVATTEQSVGVGIPWFSVGTGAGSPLESLDGTGSENFSRAVLSANQVSQLLLVQGFDFSEIPDDAIVDGIRTRLVLRDNAAEWSADAASNSSVSSSSLSPVCSRLCFLALQHPLFGLGENKAAQECLDGPEWATLFHGDADDRWGFPSLYGRDLKRGEFGLSIVVGTDPELAQGVIDVDGVELCVFYRNVY